MKKISFAAALLLAAIIITSCAAEPIAWSDAKTFSSDGMKITLTEDFEANEMTTYTAEYVSDLAVVYVLGESISGFGESGDLAWYTNRVIGNNNLDVKPEKQDGRMFFKYTSEADGEGIMNYVYTYENGGRFWFVQFVIYKNDEKRIRDDIAKWADSVVFE